MSQRAVRSYALLTERLKLGAAKIAPFLFALLVGPSVAAKDLGPGAVQVSLTPPPGYCELDGRNEREDRLIKGTQALFRLNRLLASYADCQQLVSYRSGQAAFLDDFVQVTTPIGNETAVVTEAVVKQVCSKLRSQGTERFAEIARDGQARLDQVFKDVKLNESRFLGVLADDQAACYWAALTKIRTDLGTEKAMLGVTAALTARGKLISLHSFTSYVSDATVTALLRRQKVYVAAFAAANKD